MKILHYKFLLTLISIFFPSLIFSQMVNYSSISDIYMNNYGFYDYQSTGSMESIEQDSVNYFNYNAAYLSADSSFSIPNKRVLYFFSSNGGLNWVSSVVANIESSYPSLALQADERAVICFYDSINTRIRLYRNQAIGSLAFDSFPSPPSTTGKDPKILFYKNYLFLTVVTTGSIQKTRFNYTTNSWEAWQTVASGVNSSVYQTAKGYSGKIAISWIGDSPANNVKYCESVDSGSTFGSANTVFSSVIAGTDTVRAFSHIDMVYYSNQPAITWDAIAAILPSGGQAGILKTYANPRIYFWSQPSGIQLIADSLNYSGGGSLPGRNIAASMGYNYTTLCAPSIGRTGNYLFISYSAAKSGLVFNNYWYDSDIYTKFSINETSWGYLFSGVPPDNVNDDRFSSEVKLNYPYSGGYSFALTVQKDKFPGSFRAGDTNSITRAYPEFFYVGIFVHTAEENHDPFNFDLCPAYPNPFNSSTRIEYYLPKVSHIKIDVINLLGQKVETLVDGLVNRGSSVTIFNGTNYASGVYFYRMFIEGKYFEAQKLVLVK